MKNENLNPEAYIAVGKNRQKVYGNNIVYLSDKQEFEFEFFNPTTNSIKATISINGKPISSRGLVLRPGQRGWIERYIDENRKFLFETYFVDGNSSAVKKAIESNGDIEIKFYKEKVTSSYQNNWTTFNQDLKDYLGKNLPNQGTASLDWFPPTPDSFKIGGTNHCYYSTNPNLGNYQDSSDFKTRSFSKAKELTKDLETGRIEKGTTSNQHFNSVDMDFEFLAFHTVSYKLLPVSQKPLQIKDCKLKCTNCGANLKSSWRVCPICAKPIDEESKCSSCGTKVEPDWNFCPKCNFKLK